MQENKYYHSVNIGNVTLPNNLILAPMAGVTDLPFRVLCMEQGAGLLCMEMISAKAILYNNKNTRALMEIDNREHPVSLQLFGSDPDIMADMAARIEEAPFDILDINMGCPVPKVVNNGEGSALMKDPVLAGRIVEKIADRINKPVTVKIRKGFDSSHVNAVEFAKAMQESGASAVGVHGRTREQYYEAGVVDWDIIARVKAAVSIPVFGNGDVVDGASAKRMMEQTGCDGIMIGRACRGNPWIFREIKHFLLTGTELSRPDKAEMKSVILAHAEEMLRVKGEYIAIREMRKHLGWYTAGLPGSSKLRGRINEMETMEELTASIEMIFGQGSQAETDGQDRR